MSEKTLIIYLLACSFACVLSNWIYGCANKGAVRDEPVRDTVRAVYVDTVRIVQPLARDSVVLRYIKVRVPRADSGKDTLGGTYKNSRGRYKNTDSVEAVIPITQKSYGDSTYTAWVSGFRPALDSIHVYPRREVVTVTQTSRCKAKRWGVGLHAGYGLTPRGLQPYIGFGLNYNLLNF